MKAICTGFGHAVPETTITNAALGERLGVDASWIEQRTGIQERRFLEGDKQLSDLAEAAARMALQEAALEADDLDLILFATLSSEYCFPGNGMLLQRRLCQKHIPAMDIRNQCTGFLYALSTARAYIQAGMAQKVLVVGGEVHSRGLEFSEEGRVVTSLFGDGAGAVVVEANAEKGLRIENSILNADGRHAEVLMVKSPGTWRHPHAYDPSLPHNTEPDRSYYPYMEGRRVFVSACKALPKVIAEVLPEEVAAADVRRYYFHQANLRINEHVAKSMGLTAEQCPYNIDKYGNCSAGSIPILMSENLKEERSEAGEHVVLAGFGSGFGWGAMHLIYQEL